MPDPLRVLKTRCCIVGGGPAGMMLGYLLGRAGVETLVLEKHADFLRDFRGDTVHPSTHAGDGRTRPARRIPEAAAPARCARSAASSAARCCGSPISPSSRCGCRSSPSCRNGSFWTSSPSRAWRFAILKILRSTEVIDLLRDGDRVTGVVARTAEGELRIEAGLTIGCDGRGSVVRARAGLQVDNIGAPIDVLWFRVGKVDPDPDPTLLHAVKGGMLITIDRGDYWQCAYVIAKGAIDAVRAKGLPALKQAVVAIVPSLASHIDDVRDWDDVKLLTVTIDRLAQWSQPGLLCIGDAAHAMSPVGGVGINLAIQDAVATANILAEKLGRGTVTDADLDAVRQRRLFPAKVVQAMQVAVQNRVIVPALGGGELQPPLPIRIVDAIPWLQGLTARGIGMGVRPEHVTSPKA